MVQLPPPAVLATWPTPNYVDPQTRGTALLITNMVFMALVGVAVIGRFYSRIFIRRWLGIDDAMCVLALIFTVGTTVGVILANERYAWNRHVWDIPFDKFIPASKVAFSTKLTFVVAATFTRLSLICFYYRLVKDSAVKWFNWILHMSVVYTIAVCITFVCMGIWLCVPVEAYWAFPPDPNARCLSEGKTLVGAGVVNSVSDLWTTVLPIPLVMRLKMPLRQRIGVCVLLCLGVIVTVAGALRTYYSWKSFLDSYDQTWYAYPLWICAAVELDLGLICSCAPAWKQLLQKPIREISSKITSMRSSSKGSTPYSSASAKPAVFNPLRSLPWFQHSKLDFQRTQADGDEYPLQDIEKSPGQFHEREVQQEGGAIDFRRCSNVDENRHQQAPVALQINLRHSVDQSSERIEDDGAVQPSEWLSEDNSSRILPRR